jgi:hypothetical protein
MKRGWNLFVWAGFLTTLVGFVSYFLFFYRFPITRDFPWANLLVLTGGIILLAVGLKRAFIQPERYRGKISGSILAVVSVLVFALFGFYNFYLAKQLPESKGAPRVGEKAPDFTLPDKDGRPVTLLTLLTSSIDGDADGQQRPNAALLIFYRGYW